MIEGEFDRNRYPKVYESLLAIHTAQSNSLIQQKEFAIPYEKDIIGITFEKGGSSVLADAYLVRGDLGQEESEFMFHYGVLLQIIDDLQDCIDDFNNNHMTILSQLHSKYPLDSLISKLTNFIENFFRIQITFVSEKAMVLKRVIKDCALIMIYEAVSKNKKSFSKKYIEEMEASSLVRFSYLKRVKKKFQNTFTSEDIMNICMACNVNMGQ